MADVESAGWPGTGPALTPHSAASSAQAAASQGECPASAERVANFEGREGRDLQQPLVHGDGITRESGFQRDGPLTSSLLGGGLESPPPPPNLRWASLSTGKGQRLAGLFRVLSCSRMPLFLPQFPACKRTEYKRPLQTGSRRFLFAGPGTPREPHLTPLRAGWDGVFAAHGSGLSAVVSGFPP